MDKTVDEMLILASYVKISSYRMKVMNSLSKKEVMTPTEIATDCNIRANHISKVLRELKDTGLIVCINEAVRKGRLYRLTPLGWDIKGYL